SGHAHLVRNLCMGVPMCKLNYVWARPVLLSHIATVLVRDSIAATDPRQFLDLEAEVDNESEDESDDEQ
ncbi:hypothetical protein DXG01_012851, partial [Tephrocybe rancida]